MRVWLAAVIVVFAPLACTESSSGPATPAQEAGRFLKAISVCIESNRDTVIESLQKESEAPDYAAMCGLDEEDLSPEAAPLMKESSGTVLREAFPMILRAVMAADPITGSVDEEQAETARREAVDALIAAFSTAAAEAETASSSGWYSLDRPGCVGCSGKGPAARAWAAAHPGASSTSAAPPPSRDAQAQAIFDAALAGQPLPFPERQAERAAEEEAEQVEPRPRALTAQAFAPRLSWNDMEPSPKLRVTSSVRPKCRTRCAAQSARPHLSPPLRAEA